jgi:hypothetical protein
VKRAALLVAVAVAACGRVGFEASAIDGSIGSDAADAAIDAVPACTQFGAWGTAQRIAELATSAQDYGSEISSDGLSLYWGSNDGGPDQLYMATRPSRTSTWGAARLLDQVGPGVGDPSVTGDELEIFYSHAGGPKDCIYRASRTDKADDFDAGAPVLCDSVTHHACPHVSSDGLTMVYEDGGTLLISTRPDRNAAFPEGEGFPGLFTGLSCPYITDDLLTMYYEEDAPSVIEFATRSIPSGAFDVQKQAVTEANAAGFDTEDVSLTGDGLEMHFDSDRTGGAGQHDMYFLQRECVSH